MLRPWDPLGGHLGAVFGFFVAITIVLHAIFVFRRPLSKRSWKRMDYVWLGFAALGLIGAAAEVRRLAANSQLSQFQSYLPLALQAVRGEADFLSKSPGAICRTFARSEYSPPAAEFQRIEHEYRAACDWARKVASSLPREVSARPEVIEVASLPRRPEFSETAIVHMTDGLYREIESYNSLVGTVNDLATGSERDDLELALILLGPFLLAIALAIRLTKVTGELRLG